VERGETLALIGANGSGKSTALKLMARIIYPTGGKIYVAGRVAALLELGAGFHPDLTGRENVFLNGAILGLKRAAISRQLDEIVAFADLEQFIDQPTRSYSSGMLMRLGFAVATAFQPDILLVDEVLAVGDQAFQDRCQRRIADIQAGGATIILVTHDLGAVQRLCRRAIWLQKGHVRGFGPAEEMVNRYIESVWKDEQDRQRATALASARPSSGPEAAPCADGDRPVADSQARPAKRWGSGEAIIERAELLDADAVASEVFTAGQSFRVRMWYHAREPIASPAFGIALYDDHGYRINGPNMVWCRAEPDSIHGFGYVDYVLDELPLLPGRYDLTVAIYDQQVSHPYDHWHRMASFVVVPGSHERQDGVVYIPCRWEHVPCEPGIVAPPRPLVAPAEQLARG
jgi:ABC-type polysaccharide/polyol phosphate transport system ATPase subunit